MATIKERAKEYSSTQAIQSYSYFGYVRGATDQRKIDIEKVLHALDKVVSKEILDELKKILNE